MFAKAETWLKENVGEWKIVRVNRSGSEAAFASYEMRWIPDRFQHLVQEENSAFLYSVEYNNEQYIQEKGDTPAGWGIGENEVTDSLAWGYYKTSKIKKTEMAVGVFDTEDKHWNILEEGEWKINNQEVLYYVYLINTRTETEKIARESICCIWTDETNDVTFRLDGNLSRDEAMMIVRNIKKVK